MPLKVKRYIGTVASGSGLYESAKGTLGFQVMLHCEDGATDYTIWLTEKNAERAKRDFETLGVDPKRLANPKDFTKIGDEIEGRKVSFETDEETYNERTKIKVKWISPLKDSGVGTLEQRAAVLFGAEPVADDEVLF